MTSDPVFLRARARRAAAVVRFARSGRAVRYIGWTGKDNLGDEAVLEAVRTYLQPHRLVAELPPLRGPARLVPGPHRGTVLGGGTLIGEMFYLPYAELALAKSRPLVTFGTGVADPATIDEQSADRWKAVLQLAERVTVRGPASAAWLRARGIESEVIGDPICGYARRPDERSTRSRGSRVVAVNVSAGEKPSAETATRLAALYAELVQVLVGDGWGVEYIVVSPRDRPVTQEVRAATGTQDARVIEVTDGTQVEGLTDELERMRAMVGSRLHACALATCVGLPVLAVAHHPKSLDWADSVGLRSLSPDVDQLGDRGIGAWLAELFDRGDLLAREAQERALGWRAEQLDCALSLSRMF